jgi:putative DNA primase/helicase
LILTGKQGAGKSTIFKVLTKDPDWFRDSSINVNGGRDAYSLLSGVWIYEFAELQATRTRDAESVKAFLSSCSDSYRPAYAHYDIDVPRQCVFVGTSNETEILRDPTGNRRFWVVRVTDDIDLKGFAGVVDQIWAETVHAYKSAESWWLDDDVDAMFTEHSNQFKSSDSWTTLFENWWDRLRTDEKARYNVHGLTSLDILRDVIGMDVDKIGRHHEMRVGGILNGCGFVKRRVRVKIKSSGGGEKMKRVYKYFKGTE